LKIVGIDLTSIGIVNPEGPKYEEVKKIDKERGVYKKIVLDQGKIVGSIVLGEVKSATALKMLVERGIDVTKYKDSILEENFDFRKILAK
jgi:nitrite reductase (NADH) large subunit